MGQDILCAVGIFLHIKKAVLSRTAVYTYIYLYILEFLFYVVTVAFCAVAGDHFADEAREEEEDA